MSESIDTRYGVAKYERPDWELVNGQLQRLACGRSGIRFEQDSRHAAWIRREAKKRGLKAVVQLGDGIASVRLHRVERLPDPYHKAVWDDIGRYWSGDQRAWAFVNYVLNGTPYAKQEGARSAPQSTQGGTPCSSSS